MYTEVNQHLRGDVTKKLNRIELKFGQQQFLSSSDANRKEK